MKRKIAAILGIVLLIANSLTVYACDEKQSSTRVAEIVFGDDALKYSSDENAKMLLNAVYLCSEQADNQGQDKLTYLKSKRVSRTPSLEDINIRNTELIECSHVKWEKDYLSNSKARNNRKKILLNTVNKVFDFGKFSWFGNSSDKDESFAAVLYYSHILSDYLADDPEDTQAFVSGKEVSSYCGQPYTDLNGGRPSFTSDQKKISYEFTRYSSLDGYRRAGVAFACIGPKTLADVGPRQAMTNIRPSGFNLNKDEYFGIVNSEPPYIYNRCHLLAHSLGGEEAETNLVTGTRYMNEEGMEPFEKKVAQYIKETNNHVLYRSTPVYKGDNKVVSGVQIEAYSLEDSGQGICFNVYCYNVQPGVYINYASGNNELADFMYDSTKAIPFAVNNPTESNPDLMYEMNKHLEVLFADQTGTSLYTMLMGDIDAIAYEARSGGKLDEKPAQTYKRMKECEYKYFQTLKFYVPLLLKNEDFFKSVFK